MEHEILARWNVQLLMAESYSMSYEQLFRVINQTHAAQSAPQYPVADTTPDSEAPINQAWIDEYHNDALNREEEA